MRAAAFVWILVTATLLLPAAEGPCSPVPDGRLAPGEVLRLDGRAFVLAARVESGLADAATTDRLVLDLRILHMDTRTRAARRGSYVPGLDVTYALSGDDGRVSAGGLEFRLADEGPGYGATLELPRLDDDRPLDLEIVTRGRPAPAGAACDAQERRLSYRLLPGSLRVASAVEGPAFVRGGSNGDRMTLVGQLDARPAESYSDIWGYSDGTTHLAIIGSTNGTVFIDVTVPSSPVEVGSIPGPSSSWRDIKTYGTHAYIVTEGGGAGLGMQIVDLSDPSAPALVNTYTQTLTTAHNIWIDTVRGHAWVWGTGNGTRILDLSQNPTQPTEVGSFTARYVHDGYVADDFAYLSEINSGKQEIFDSTDVGNLSLLASFATPRDFTHNCWANDDHSILATTDERSGAPVAIYDITNKTGPIPELSRYQPNSTTIVHNVAFDDEDNERIAISHYTLGLNYVDLHRPTFPVQLGSYDTYPSNNGGSFNGAWGVYPFDARGYIYISDISTGLYVLQYAPTGGTLSGIVRDATTSQPVSGARVVVLPEGTLAQTGADGLYALYAQDGTVTLRVSADGYLTRLTTAGQLLLGERLDADVELDPLPRVALSGTVRRQGDLVGIEGATVSIAGTGMSTTTGAGGSFSFPDVGIGQRTLTAEVFGYASQEARVLLQHGQPGSVDLLLEPGFFTDDGESDLGWLLGRPGDTAGSGVWERVDPNGTGGGAVQPEDDRTPAAGVAAFITGQSPPGAGIEDNDVDDGWTSMFSPSIDLSGVPAARLRYHRWISNTADALNGGNLRVEVGPGFGSLIQLENVLSNANDWGMQEFDLGSFIPLTGNVRLQFRAEAIPGSNRVLECGIDDIDVVRGCLARFSPENPDGDGDGTVDLCDACAQDVANDTDGDGICGDVDNAPFVANSGQQDTDVDSIGDAADNCGTTGNADQRDLDDDGIGDACDDDTDGDGLLDVVDGDDDDDGVADAADLCPSVPDTDQRDDDLDGQGDACDADDGIVQGLRLDRDVLTWEPESASDDYNVYRGDLGAEALLSLATCRAAGTPAAFFVDTDLPVPGDGFFYLVSRTASGAEGPLGFRTDGSPRIVSGACP